VWRIVTLLCMMGVVAQYAAASRVTVAELQHLLTSKAVRKAPDEEVAELLGTMVLNEQLTEPTLAKIEAGTKLGPKAAEQLELLADRSVFQSPPPNEIPALPPPDAARQKQIFEAAARYTRVTLHNLPDLLATRETTSFSDGPQKAAGRHSKPKVQLHFLSEHQREISYRDGREVEDSAGGAKAPGGGAAGDSLTTWGEFGPVLEVVFEDAVQGNVTWSRWQRNGKGHLLAVFHFAVPKSASHYEVDLCCYARPPFESLLVPFSDTLSYQGELAIDPDTGVIYRLTLESELANDAPVKFTGMLVEYGSVTIGGKSFVCPIKGLAVSTIRNAWMKEETGVGEEEFVNIIRFQHYHRFASTSRVITGRASDAPQ
jgi:hypothetical protein